MPVGGSFAPVLVNEPKKNQSFNEAPNGVLVAFTTSEFFVVDGSLDPVVTWNGQKLYTDYVASESGGAGTGYDTITFPCAPKSTTELLIDYYVA
jgi:hypothetical protein